MRATRTSENALIAAALCGDRRALDELVTAYLPLVYTIVRRALGGQPDVDDVVQDVMLRAVRQLHLLRDPERFRPWLAAIAVHQVSTHLRRARTAQQRLAALDQAAELADEDADVEAVTLLEVDLSAQRRQVVRASQWLDPDDRALLALWWLEVAGQLTRNELASALEVSVAHAGVRIQRMRQQLDLSRAVVAALGTRPRCPRLQPLLVDWDGSPGPLWRKRIARHIRSCDLCTHAGDDVVAAERLLAGYALLPLPLPLAAAVTANLASSGGAVGASTVALTASGGAGVKLGLLGQLAQAVGAHPVAASVAAGALVVGSTATAVTWAPPAPPPPLVVEAAPTPTPATRPVGRQPTLAPPAPPPAPPAVPPATLGPVALGPISLESVNMPGRFVIIEGSLGVLKPLTNGTVPAGQLAALEVVAGLADPACFSFRGPDGRYLRHASWRVQLSQDEGTPLFRGDATFCVREGTIAGSVSFEASNYPGWFLRHRNFELWVDYADGTAIFGSDSSFVVRAPVGG
jgi:RNA polymerase sigma factor (sigma-70 family)